MDDVTRDRFTFSDGRLENGEVLPEVVIAYSTRGRLAADGRNAVLVTHGYTSGHQMIEPSGTSSEGSWTTLVGPGAPVDTDRNFVVASNMLGSSFGSTNASFTDPRTGRRYGSRFPRISVHDIVAAQYRLLQHLGVTHLRAVVGPSYGGFQAFQWAVSYPDFMDGIVPVVSAPKARLNMTTDTRARFEHDPNWNGGDYYDTPGGMRDSMIALRMETLRRYGMTDDAAIRRAAGQWAGVFDANSLLILGHAAEGYDVSQQLGRIKVPVLYVLSRTDALFPPERAPAVMQALRDARVDATYFEIDSDKGHLASGADAEKWAPALR
ncbi:MAG: alpha/beta fold hydrolase, partial [Rhodanobacteraceae bacterium]